MEKTLLKTLKMIGEEVDSLIDENIKLKADIAEKDKIIEDLRVILARFSKSSGIQY